jgi:Ser/Thr protein kinase RdoA (MazF antagonist)
MYVETIQSPQLSIITEIAALYGLENPRLHETPHEGMGYTTFQLSTAKGDFALRRKKGSPIEIRTKHPDIDQRLNGQHAFMTFLHDHGFPVAPPLFTRDGRSHVSLSGIPYSLYPFINGQPIERGNLRQLARAGQTLGVFHQLTAAYEGPTPISLDASPKMFRDGYEVFLQHADALDEMLGACGIAGSIYSFRANLMELEEEIQNLTYGNLPQAVIHGDYPGENILFKGDDVVGVLDFGRSRREARVLDLANVTQSLMRTTFDDYESFLPFLQVFATGYKQALPLDELEYEALPLLTQTRVALKAFDRARRLVKKGNDIGDKLLGLQKFMLLARRLQWLRANSAVLRMLFE